MKSLSAFELRFIVNDLKEIDGSKVDNVYSMSDGIIISLFKSNQGNFLLRIINGKAIFLTEEKNFSELTNFCSLLRKNLRGKGIEEIKQKGFERIIELKINGFRLIIELFSKGNIILCKEDKIFGVYESQDFGVRKLKNGEVYLYPKSKLDLFSLGREELKKILMESKRENIVKTLAIEFSFGGVIAEEICLRAEVNKNKKELSKEEIEKILDSLEEIKDLKLNAHCVFDDGLIDVLPFDLLIYKGDKKEYFKSFSNALEFYFKQEIKETKNIGLDKLEGIIEEQKEHIKELEREIIEDKEKGDWIYKNYNLIEQLIKEIKESKWKIKSKIIKELRPDKGEMIIEV